QVYVQDSPAAQELIYASQDRLDKEEPDEAARLLQQVFDEHASKLMEHDEDGVTSGGGAMMSVGPRYSEARRVAQRALGKDPVLLASYRAQFEPLAAKALERAGGDRDDLGNVLRLYGMTRSGLEAALRLAGLGIESGDPGPAMIALRDVADHPDLKERRDLWTWLNANALLLSGDPDAALALKGAMGADYAAQTDHLAQTLSAGSMETSLSPLDPLPYAGPRVMASAPLWETDVGGAEDYLLDVLRSDESQLDSVAPDGRYLSPMPVVRNGLLYVSDGEWARAIEPSSGYEVWRAEIAGRETQPSGYRQPYSRWLPYGVDMNLLEVDVGRVVAIAGYGSLATLYPRTDSRSDLVALDADTGQMIWRVEPGGVDKSLEGGYWYGRPVIAQGRVYATLRVRQRTQFQDAYLVALDLEEGSVSWMRHLASTAMTDRQAVPTMNHMLLHEGWLYIDSRLGTIAKISTVNGAVDWLAVAPIDPDRRTPNTYKPWHGSAPVMVEAGLLVLDDWASEVRVFDPLTGLVKAKRSSADWNDPRFLVESGGDVLAMGMVVTRLDGATLKPKWRYETGGDVRGRPSITTDRVFLPTDEEVVVLDMANGQRVGALEVDTPVTVLALDGQVVVVGRTRMGSYSTWEVASARMLDRVKERPTDPRPWMAMGWLAYRTGRPEPLLQSLDNAVRLITDAEVDSTLGRELFDQMMTMARDAERADANLRQEVFDRMPDAIGNADQEVAYRLELGAFYEAAGKAEHAIEQYQTLLEEPNHRRLLYRHAGG
ncbi:MAG: outer membrane protein assembly factor BamB family protein, partial [Planctomycetota bacterium]